MEDPPFSITESASAATRGQVPLYLPQQPNSNKIAATSSVPAVAPKDSSYIWRISTLFSPGPDQSGTKEGANPKVAIPRQRLTVAQRYSIRIP
jgi:hypothetical protein